MLRFKLEKERKGDRMVVEVWDDDDFIACIYPHEGFLSIVSKYLRNAFVDEGNPPAVVVLFVGKSESGYGS
jgi:hypothetical protein